MARSYKRTKQIWLFKKQLKTTVWVKDGYRLLYKKEVWLQPEQIEYQKLRVCFFSEKFNYQWKTKNDLILNKKGHRRREKQVIKKWLTLQNFELMLHDFKKEGQLDYYW